MKKKRRTTKPNQVTGKRQVCFDSGPRGLCPDQEPVALSGDMLNSSLQVNYWAVSGT